MHNVLDYKGYYGSVGFSAEENILFGRVIGIDGLVCYEGDSVQSLKDEFEGAVDHYLASCAAKGLEPEEAYRGKFNVVVPPELHRALAQYAAGHGQTLNATVEDALELFVMAESRKNNLSPSTNPPKP